MNTHDFHYPEHYTDFNNGLNCSDGEVNDWIKKGLTHLKKEVANGVKNPSFSISTGNTIVWGNAYKQDNGKYTISVHVSRAYEAQWHIDREL